ncbi:siderophore ABC transporter substrate-binding protein [Amphibacillus sediminis]
MLICTVFIVACGSNKDSSGDKSNNSSDQEQQGTEVETEIEVEHDLGVTKVPVNPEKVVVFDFGTLDTLDALGVDIIALPKQNIPSYLAKFEDETYQNAGTLFEPDFEALSAIDPDLIIISGRTSEAYDELANLAPTIYLGIDTGDYITSFESNVMTLAEIFDKEAEAESAVAQIKADVEALKELAPTDQTGLVVLTNDGSLSAYGPGSRFGIIHDDFGIIPTVEDIEESNHGQNISFEFVAEMNPDYLFVVDRNAVTGGDYTASATLDNELINQTNAAQEDQIVDLTPDYWYLSSGGIESVTQMIAEIRAAVE